jgi:ligand-binding sensor domain-containing protein
MKTVSLFCLLVLLLWSTNVEAQHVGYKLYTVEEGLAQSEVTVIHQDPKGLLWVGTKSGVCRFDGRAFQTINDLNQVTLGNITLSLPVPQVSLNRNRHIKPCCAFGAIDRLGGIVMGSVNE